MRLLRSMPLVVVLGSMVLAASAFWLLDTNEESLRQGREHMASRRWAEALTALAQVQGDAVSSRTVLEARLLEARAKLLSGAAKEAMEAARTLADSLPLEHPGKGRAHGVLSDALMESGLRDEAARVLGDMARGVLSDAHKQRVAGYYLMVAKSLEEGEPSGDPLRPGKAPNPAAAAEMSRCALEVLTGGKPFGAVTVARARQLLAANAPQQAIPELRELLKGKDLADKLVAEARFLLARAESVTGAQAEARTTLNLLLSMASVEETPFAAEGRVLLGDALTALGDPESWQQGLAAWKSFLERHPDHARAPEVRQRIAQACLSAELLPEAIAAFKVVAADAGAKPEVRAAAAFTCGLCARRMEAFDDARTALQQYIAAWPDHQDVPEAQALLPALLVEKAAMLRRKKEDAAALAALQQCLQEYPLAEGAAAVAVETGVILRHMKRFDDAVLAFAAARDRYREHAPEDAAQAGLLLGAVEGDHRNNFEAAVAAWKLVVERHNGTEAAAEAQRRIAELESVELALSVPRMFAPAEKPVVALRSRNIKAATFRVVKLDAREYFVRRGTLLGAENLEVELVKADRTLNFDVPQWRRYVRTDLEIPLTREDGTALGEGAYLVNVEAEQRRSVVLVLISSLRVVVKEAPTEVFCWVVDAASGLPREGVELLLRGAAGEHALRTDKDGVARLAHKSTQGRTEVLALAGDSVAPGMPMEPAKATKAAPTARASFLLDRPLYRTGAEVRWRALIRDVDAGVFRAPSQVEASAQVLDARGRVLGEDVVNCDAFGSCHGSFRLPEAGETGEHRLLLRLGKQQFEHRFSVEEYKRPDMLVDVTPAARVVRPGERLDFLVKARYFFGGAPQQVAFEWRAWRESWTPDKQRYLAHARYLKAVEASKPPRAQAGMQYLGSGAGTLDAEGAARFTLDTAADGKNSRYVVQVLVRDTTGNLSQGGGMAFAAPVDRFAVVLPAQKTWRAGDEIEVRVVSADQGHAAVATRGVLSALRRVEGSAGGFESEARVDVDTGVGGESTLRMRLNRAGEYRLRFEGSDCRGTAVVAEARTTLTGERPDLAQEALLRFESETALGGAETNVHLSLPRAGRPVLMTVEGEGILDWFIMTPEAKESVRRVLMKEAWAPNITLAVAAPHDGKLLTSEDQIIVLTYVDVKVTPEKARALPREKMKVGISTKDQLGRAVPASVAVRVVDQALSDLAEGAQDPRVVFHQDLREHLVRTGSSFTWRSSGETRFLDPDLLKLATESKLRELELNVAGKAGEPVPTLGGRLRTELAARGRDEGGLAEDRSKDLMEELEDLEKSDAPAEKAKDSVMVGQGAGAGGGGRKTGAAFGGRSALKQAPRAGGSPAPGHRPQAPEAPPAAEAESRALRRSKQEADYKRSDDPDRGGRLAWGDKNFDDAQRDAFANAANDQHLGFLGGLLPIVPDLVRQRFADVAAFWPDLITNADGIAERELELPDNLTSFDCTASGMTVGLGSGLGKARITVSKPAIARIDGPRFLATGDALALPVEVRNNLESAGRFRTQFSSKVRLVAEVSGQDSGDLEVPALGAATHEFNLRAVGQGAAMLSVAARSAEAHDALEQALPVMAFGEPWRFARTEDSVRDRTECSVDIPAGLVAGSLSATAVIHAGMAAELLEGLQFLAQARYGCLEQGLWRFLTAAQLQEAFRAAGRPLPLDAAELRRDVQHGFTQLLAHQTADGAFAFWPGGNADAFSTAQALSAIAWLEAAGYTAPPGMRQSALNGATQFLGRAALEPDARAALVEALYACGAKPEAQFNAVYRERAALSAAAFARLVLASARTGNPGQRVALLQELLQKRMPSGDFAGRGAGHWHTEALEANALVLIACRVADAGPEVSKTLAARVRSQLRTRSGGTKAVALAVEALALHIQDEGGLAADSEVTLSVDGTRVASGRLSATQPLVALTIPASTLSAGKHQLSVVRQGGGEVSVRFLCRAVLPAESVAAAGNVLEVSRRITAWRDPSAADAEHLPGWSIVRPEERPKNAPLPQLREALAGSKVGVEIVVRAREDCAHVVIEDPLLATLEPILDAVTGRVDRHERRDHQMRFFKNSLRKGEVVVIRYPAWVVHAGQFRALPPQAEEMYDATRYGRGQSAALSVVASPTLLAATPTRELTPDELWDGARRDFREQRFAAAGDTVDALLARWKLVDAVHDEALEILLRSRLVTEDHRTAVRAREELAMRAPGRLQLNAPDRERMAAAYLAVGDPVTARSLWQDVVLEGFQGELAVARTWRELGLAQPALHQLRDALLRYPATGSVIDEERVLADWQLATRDPKAPPELVDQRAHLWQDALDTWLDLMAWHPATAVAEDAAWRRVAMYAQLGAGEAMVREASRYRAEFANHGRADEIAMAEARMLYELRRFPAAKDLARRVEAEEWPRRTNQGTVAPARSSSRWMAGWLLGQLAHVEGDYQEAVKWYGAVKDEVPAARESHAFFTRAELQAPAIAQSKTGVTSGFAVTAKNIEKLTARLHAVDLLVLFAVKKDFANVVTAELPGLPAAARLEQASGLQPFTRGEVQLDLGRREPGAWLVVLEGGGKTASTLLLVSDAQLVCQRENGTIRCQFTGKDNKPVAGARVKMAHGGRIVQSGETDLRGMLDLPDPGSGEVTLVAEQGAAVGVVRLP
jgi:uncharacterized protein YfaS (alpha-2-macroglobulin family)/tetratricopeptide (TPR) repeat protein